MLEGIWIQGLAAEWGIEVSDQEIAKKLKEIKKESFKSEAEFKKFLKESHYTPDDLDTGSKIQILSDELQKELKERTPTPSKREVENYYEAAKATQFTQKPSRDVRMVVNKDRKKAEAAHEALAKDNTAKNWSKVAKKYSEDPTTKESGGLQKGLQEGILEEPLDAAIFGTPEGQVEGPLKAKRGYVVFEVVNSTPESVQELKAVESQIEATMAQQAEQEYATNFVAGFNTQWTQRTFCASDWVTERCANYESNGHPVDRAGRLLRSEPENRQPKPARRRCSSSHRRCRAASPRSNRRANRWPSARGRRKKKKPKGPKASKACLRARFRQPKAHRRLKKRPPPKPANSALGRARHGRR